MTEEKKSMVPKLRFPEFTATWEQRKLCDLGDFNPKSVLPEEFEYVDLESVVGTELLGHRKEILSAAPSRAQRLAAKGDIFFQTVRPYQKHNYLFDRKENNFVFSTGYAQIRPSINPYFLFNLLQIDSFVKRVLDNCTGTSYPAISSGVLSSMFVSISPSTKEREKIGLLFLKLDRTITLHQRKLEGLSKLKKSLLQKMFPKNGSLGSELRFPGFTGDWEQHKLGDLGHTYGGLSGKSKQDFGHGDARFVTYMNVFSNPIGDPCMVDSIEIDDRQSRVRKGDVLFTTSSETPDEVGMSCVWPSDSENLYLNSFCFGYRPTTKINSNFLASLLRSPSVREKIIFLAQGISRYNISKNKVMEISIPLPSEEEQSQIGDFFTQLDKTITLHQRKLESLKKLKKSLLQQMFV